MAVLVGIDEAGYGPLLGPLVVSSVAFSLHDELVKSDLWSLLKTAVGKRKSKLAGRLLITDSKKAYSRKAGIGHLRRTVLAHLYCLEEGLKGSNANAGRLLEVLCGSCVQRLLEYPWYEGISNKMLGGNSEDIEISSRVLKRAYSDRRVKLLNMSSRCLDVAYYNRMITAVQNKASVLFTAVAALIKDSFDAYAAEDSEPLQIIIDRQGGRINYRRALQRMFENMELKIIRQDNKVSSYELTESGRRMRLHFVTAADRKYLAVSLASMTSKFLREILVDSINSYFLQRCSGLRPTAGYWKDGQRFIKELKDSLGDTEYDSQKLIRCR
jgi:ribonuclease HII